MENEYERILDVFDTYSNVKDKTDFLLRQIESLVEVINAYREQILPYREREEMLKSILNRTNK